MLNDSTEIAIIGAGAIGGVTAACLKNAGRNVQRVCKHQEIVNLIKQIEAGNRKLGHHVVVAHYTQEFEQAMNIASTALEEVGAGVSGIGENALRTLLGSFGFSGDEIAKLRDGKAIV